MNTPSTESVRVCACCGMAEAMPGRRICQACSDAGCLISQGCRRPFDAPNDGSGVQP